LEGFLDIPQDFLGFSANFQLKILQARIFFLCELFFFLFFEHWSKQKTVSKVIFSGHKGEKKGTGIVAGIGANSGRNFPYPYNNVMQSPV
jgi:hypothetical protein